MQKQEKSSEEDVDNLPDFDEANKELKTSTNKTETSRGTRTSKPTVSNGKREESSMNRSRTDTRTVKR